MKNKIVFLDRDGVINEYPGDNKYVTSWGEFHFLPGVKEAIKKLKEADFKAFIISNQAGISKGIFSQESLNNITENMLKEIKETGGLIEDVFYCIHRDEDNCSCRKPKTGLIKKAFRSLCDGNKKREEQNSKYFFIGDTIRDIQTGKSAGCETILVFSGKEKPRNKDFWTVQPDYIAQNLSEAVNMIINL